jgi:guanylate kinase
MIAAGVFLEIAAVHGNRYGTPRAQVEEAVRSGRTLLLDIDVQGARSVRAGVPDAVLIFVDPPSVEALRARLEARGTDPPEVIAQRLESAAAEMAEASWFDHRIVNDDLARAVYEVIRILESPATEGASS